MILNTIYKILKVCKDFRAQAMSANPASNVVLGVLGVVGVFGVLGVFGVFGLAAVPKCGIASSQTGEQNLHCMPWVENLPKKLTTFHQEGSPQKMSCGCWTSGHSTWEVLNFSICLRVVPFLLFAFRRPLPQDLE